MKKIIFIVSLILIAFTSLFLLYFDKGVEEEEDVFSIKTSYSYIYRDGVNFSIKLYSNIDDSLLLHGKEGQVFLHDSKKEDMVLCTVDNVYINETVLFEDNYYYEYIYDLSLNMTTLNIKECYLSVLFSNKEYDFNIGSFEIKDEKFNENIINISNLYGLTSDDNNKSLCGIVLTINNTTSKSITITDAYIGSNYKTFVNPNYLVECSESNNIYDYINDYNNKKEITNSSIIIKSNEKITIVLPIKYQKNYYLYNTYLLFKINNKTYYFPNFTYIDSADIDVMNKYVVRGFIYDI